MKCEECVKEGKTSCVYPGMSSTTLLAWQTYYDEDGKFVNDNPNRTTTSYKCSRGHSWTEVN